MSKVEVLVACMHQTDDSLFDGMNLQTDAVLANQSAEFFYREYVREYGRTVKLVTTPDRGVGKNRNKGLAFATGEYVLFADQDMIYVDDYQHLVLEAFQVYPNADMVIFNLDYLNRTVPGKKAKSKGGRVHWWNSMRYGTARIAAKRSSLEKCCLSFSTLYGGGARFSSGEDSLFIRDALRKGLKMYYYPQTIAAVKQEESSWFRGFTDKYFIDKGVLIANAFPFMKYFLIFYFAYRMRNFSSEHSLVQILRLMVQGFGLYKSI